MRSGILGCGVMDSRWRSMALISRSSSRTLGRSPLARTPSACWAGEVLLNLLLLAADGGKGFSDRGALLRVEWVGSGLPGSAGGEAG